MSGEPITLDVARRILREAMETQGPDFVYKQAGTGGSCYNVPYPQARAIRCKVTPFASESDARETTGCLVGTALTLHGFTWHREEDLASSIRGIATRYTVLFPDWNVVRYLAAAQNVQDLGKTWGEAVQAAEEWYGARVALAAEVTV